MFVIWSHKILENELHLLGSNCLSTSICSDQEDFASTWVSHWGFFPSRELMLPSVCPPPMTLKSSLSVMMEFFSNPSNAAWGERRLLDELRVSTWVCYAKFASSKAFLQVACLTIIFRAEDSAPMSCKRCISMEASTSNVLLIIT